MTEKENSIYNEYGRKGYIEKITDQHLSKIAPKYVTDRVPKNKKLSGSEKMQQKPIYVIRTISKPRIVNRKILPKTT
jgi:hypothetical protein